MSPAFKAPTEEVSSLDVLKVVAVVLMIVDHVGLYVIANDWLRVLGRPAAVIFGFLIGFSRSTKVPPIWIALGLGLTLLQGRLSPGDDEHALDILISLALTRSVMPAFDRLHDIHPLTLVPAGIGLALLAEPLNVYVEYGSEVTLAALLGVAVRLDRGEPEQRAARDATALVALTGLSIVALRHFEFAGWTAIACTGLLAVTILSLTHFRSGQIAVPAGLAPLLRLAGRNTLWIYALHLAALQIGVWWLTTPLDD